MNSCRRTTVVVWATVASIVSGVPSTGSAQIRASELGMLAQTIDGTRITITYSRPRTRGRPQLFGSKAAHWGETWTPGANWATVFEANKDVTLNGRTVPKGKYSVWMVLRETGAWTTILDPDWHRFHMEPPDSNTKQIRIPTRVDSAAFVDVLTWSMPEMTVSGGTLAMQWGTTRAVMQLGVTPSLEVTMPEAEARPFVGRYDYLGRSGSDSGKVSTFIVLYENKTLKARWEPQDDYMQTFALIRVAPDIFVPGLYDRAGQIYEVLRPDMVFSFKRVGTTPTTFEVRDETDLLQATGKRRP